MASTLRDCITVSVRKPAIPVLWLDSSVFIQLAKLKAGEIPDDERLSKLKKIVLSLVHAGKLLCIESSQRYELSKRLLSDIHKELLALTLGLRLDSSLSVFRRQVREGMRACRQGDSVLSFDSSTFFRSDPVVEAKAILDRQFVIAPRLDVSAFVKQRRDTSGKILKEWKDIQASCRQEGRKFDEWLDAEKDSFAFTMTDARKRKALGESSANLDALWLQRNELFIDWSGLGGPADEFEGFFVTDYFKQLPSYDILTRLNADFMVQGSNLRESDQDDAAMLADVVPISSFVVTDRAMECRMRRLGIPKRWGTSLFSMKTVSELIEILQRS